MRSETKPRGAVELQAVRVSAAIAAIAAIIR
jgi:hypothetical protein